MAEETATAKTTAKTAAQDTATDIKSEVATSGFRGRANSEAEKRKIAAEKAQETMKFHESIMSKETKDLLREVKALYGEVPPDEAEFLNNGMHMLSIFSGSYATEEVDKDNKTVYRGTWMNPCRVFIKPKGAKEGMRISVREAVQLKNFIEELFDKDGTLIRYGMSLEKDIARYDLDNSEYDKI